MARKALQGDQIVKLIVGAGQASPSPPVGPALGSKGVKSMDFCKVSIAILPLGWSYHADRCIRSSMQEQRTTSWAHRSQRESSYDPTDPSPLNSEHHRQPRSSSQQPA